MLRLLMAVPARHRAVPAGMPAPLVTPGLLGDKEHLPDMLAPFEEPVRLGGVADRKGGSDGYLDRAAPDQLQRRGKIVGWRQPESDDAPAVAEERDKIERHHLAGVRAAGHEG